MEYIFEYLQQQFFPVNGKSVNNNAHVQYYPRPQPLQRIAFEADNFDHAQKHGENLMREINLGSDELDIIYAAVVSKNHKKRELQEFKPYETTFQLEKDHKVIKLEERLLA